ncbi:hypothetical protein Ae717Ps2_6190c [Pseudonocardia sp. Ae717_Ps2]|uniref:hypothetical protein n=1 Tax=Pseudonocardia sp. Ae717_Ps2 TaxID=1885573 RepID=UPI000965C648|nr:hypothetical protein [Pseudonocardia sp. Ae717_Ps2]OLM28594.1 hypothetical protein Ae717Ps2_6190c [Pseudonocardia sp. Ae717_Ps2]
MVARPNENGEQVLLAYRPVQFTLDQTARAMNAVIDPHLRKLNARSRVGRSRVREVLRLIVTDGWPPGFSADPDRVAYWRAWLLSNGIFTDDSQ